MTRHPNRDLLLIEAAGFLRSLGVGLMGVVLGIYLFRLGLSSFDIGLIIASGLAGSALATVVTSVGADRVGRKRFLVALSLLSAVGGIAFAETPNLSLLAITAFAGMLNGTGTDRSAAYALDQAVVPELVPDLKRTWSLAWYNVFLDGGGSIGALGAGLPLLVQHHFSLSILLVPLCAVIALDDRFRVVSHRTHLRHALKALTSVRAAAILLAVEQQTATRQGLQTRLGFTLLVAFRLSVRRVLGFRWSVNFYPWMTTEAYVVSQYEAPEVGLRFKLPQGRRTPIPASGSAKGEERLVLLPGRSQVAIRDR